MAHRSPEHHTGRIITAVAVGGVAAAGIGYAAINSGHSVGPQPTETPIGIVTQSPIPSSSEIVIPSSKPGQSITIPSPTPSGEAPTPTPTETPKLVDAYTAVTTDKSPAVSTKTITDQINGLDDATISHIPDIKTQLKYTEKGNPIAQNSLASKEIAAAGAIRNLIQAYDLTGDNKYLKLAKEYIGWASSKTELGAAFPYGYGSPKDAKAALVTSLSDLK